MLHFSISLVFAVVCNINFLKVFGQVQNVSAGQYLCFYEGTQFNIICNYTQISAESANQLCLDTYNTTLASILSSTQNDDIYSLRQNFATTPPQSSTCLIKFGLGTADLDPTIFPNYIGAVGTPTNTWSWRDGSFITFSNWPGSIPPNGTCGVVETNTWSYLSCTGVSYYCGVCNGVRTYKVDIQVVNNTLFPIWWRWRSSLDFYVDWIRIGNITGVIANQNYSSEVTMPSVGDIDQVEFYTQRDDVIYLDFLYVDNELWDFTDEEVDNRGARPGNGECAYLKITKISDNTYSLEGMDRTDCFSNITNYAEFAFPTVEPTPPSQAPSNIPSGAPSYAPSKSPSKAPSKFPSKAPILFPSNAPSILPSFTPSLAPITPPTGIPSLIPTQTPSRAPVQPPTSIPTELPSDMPSIAPISPKEPAETLIDTATSGVNLGITVGVAALVLCLCICLIIYFVTREKDDSPNQKKEKKNVPASNSQLTKIPQTGPVATNTATNIPVNEEDEIIAKQNAAVAQVQGANANQQQNGNESDENDDDAATGMYESGTNMNNNAEEEEEEDEDYRY